MSYQGNKIRTCQCQVRGIKKDGRYQTCTERCKAEPHRCAQQIGPHSGLQASGPHKILKLEERSQWEEFTTGCNRKYSPQVTRLWVIIVLGSRNVKIKNAKGRHRCKKALKSPLHIKTDPRSVMLLRERKDSINLVMITLNRNRVTITGERIIPILFFFLC